MKYASTAYATQVLGISKVRLNELARKGKVPRGPRPNQWDIQACQKALGQNLDPRYVTKAKTTRPEKKPQAQAPARKDEPEPPKTPEPPKGTLLYEQWRLTREKADREALERKALEGTLLKREEVKTAVSAMIAAAKTKLSTTGDELCDHLAAMSDPVACRELVDNRIREALSVLAEYPRE